MRQSFLIFLVLLAFPGQGSALDPASLFKKVSPSVVVVRSTEQDRPGSKAGSQGSGVVIADNTVITNYHVVKYAPVLRIEYQGKRYKAKIQYADVERDLCQLIVEDLAAPPIDKVSYKTLGTGDGVFAIGAPQGLDLTLSQGLISSIRVKGESILIQTSAAISKGSSGGGLFDKEGRLIGITTLMVSTGQNLNFAVPADWIDELPGRSVVNSEKGGQHLLETTMFTRKKQYAKAVEAAGNWLKLEPRNGLAYALRGDAYTGLKHYDLAIEDMEKLIAIPDRAYMSFRLAAHKGLGDTLGRLRRYRAAIKAYQQFIQEIRALPKTTPQQNLLIAYCIEKIAFAYVSLENFPKAIDFFTTLQSLLPTSPAPSASIGRAYAWDEQYENALKAFDQGLSKAPGNANILFEKARALAALGRESEARRLYSRIQSKPVWGGLASKELGKLDLAKKNYAQALSNYRKAWEERPREIGLQGVIGRILLRRKSYAEAASALKQYLGVYPDQAKDWLSLGKAQLKMKRAESAEESLNRAVILDPTGVSGWYLLGISRLSQKKFDLAVEALREAVQRSPKNASMLYRLGLAYIAQGDRRKVGETMRKLAPLNRSAALELKKKATRRGLSKGKRR